MKMLRATSLIALILVGCSDSSPSPLAPVEPSLSRGASGVVMVTTSGNDGPGSFRSAVAQANADASIRGIRFRPNLSPIHLLSSVVFDGGQALEIQGHGGILDGSSLGLDETNFLANGGGDIEVFGLTVRNGPGHGLIVQVPTLSVGTQRIVLRNVTALENMGHGVEINDQEDPDDAGDPDNGVRGNPNGSDASLEVTVIGSTFERNGFGALDRDGLRINEGGVGDLRVSIINTRADRNGADGVELDERGPGHVEFEILRSHFSFNGDFDQSAEPDKDDGFDADEGDEGDFVARVILSTANDNFEEGFDFNENDAGDMRIDMTLSEASRNVEEGIDLEEDDDWQGGGDLIARLVLVKANGNAAGDGGIKIRERGEGDLLADLRQATASGNGAAGIHVREQAGGDLHADVLGAVATANGAEGIFLREDDDGSHFGTVRLSRADGNTAYGINFDENGVGDLTASVALSSASDNDAHGVRADEADSGAGTLVLTRVTMAGNGSDGTDGNVPATP